MDLLATNSSDRNLKKHIRDIRERQVTALTSPYRNIFTLSDRCFDIWRCLSPLISRKLIESMQWRTVPVFQAKQYSIIIFLYQNAPRKCNIVHKNVVQQLCHGLNSQLLYRRRQAR